MTTTQDRSGRAQPVDRFKPTSGQVVGHLSLAAIAVLLAYIALNVHTVTGLRVGLGLLFFGVLIWVTQLRPRATAYPDVLHVKNSVRDVMIPLVAIDEVRVKRMLSVWVGEQRHVCVGIGEPLGRSMRGGRSGLSARLGSLGIGADVDAATPPRPGQSSMSYGSFVESRIRTLAEEARRSAAVSGPGTPAALPRHMWNWPEIVALAGTGAAFALSLLV